MWEIKMVNSKSFESLNKKLKLCDENKLRNTQRKKLSFGGTNQKTKHFKRNNKIHEKNLHYTRQFIENIASKNKFVESKLHPQDTNINFRNIPISDVLAFLDKFEYHAKDDILYSVKDFIDLNRNTLNPFSVVLKQKRGKDENEISPVWKLKDSTKNIEHTIKGLTRGDQNPQNDDFYYNDNLRDSDKDNTFDLIDEMNISKYTTLKSSGDGSKYIDQLRDESRVPLLIIYIIKGEVERGKPEIFFPSLYLSIPNVGQPVTYTVRNKLN
jgi:hypothetical protein